MAEHHDPLEPSHLIAHVQDSDYFDVPRFLSANGKLEIPQPFKLEGTASKYAVFEMPNFAITKFMLLEVVAAILIAVVFIRLATDDRRAAAPEGSPVEPARSDAAVHSRRRGPAGHRRSRRRSVPAVLVDDVLLRPGLQPVGAGAVGRLGHRVAGHDRGAGAVDVCHRGRRRHGEARAGRLLASHKCRTWILPPAVGDLPDADDLRASK